MKGWSRSILGAAAAAALVLGGGAIAVADDLETTVTGDELTVSATDVDLGALGCETSKSLLVTMKIDRAGGGSAVFENGSFVTFTVGADTAGVTATQPAPIQIPGGWEALPPQSTTDSDATTSTITVDAGAVSGDFSAHVTYDAIGPLANPTPGNATRELSETVNLEWSVDCGVVDPVDERAPIVTLLCPSDPIPQGEEAHATWTAADEDGGSGVAEGFESGQILLDTTALGEHTATAPAGTAEDNAGNLSAEASCTFTVVDVTPPVVVLVCPTAPVLLDSFALATWTATDEEGGSGLATAPSGSIELDTSTVGAHIATAGEGTAADNAGNASAAVSCEFSVVYDFDGFFRPVDMDGVVNSVKAGSAVPMKFGLGGDQGLDVIAAGYPKILFTACATAETDAIETTVTAGASSLSYDPVAGQYVYVWKTDKSWAGKCGTFALQLDDGVTRTAKFKFLK